MADEGCIEGLFVIPLSIKYATDQEQMHDLTELDLQGTGGSNHSRVDQVSDPRKTNPLFSLQLVIAIRSSALTTELGSLKKCIFLCLGSGDEQMEMYDNEEGDDDSDDGIEVEDNDDDENEESMSPVNNAAGSSSGKVVFQTLHSCLCTMLCLALSCSKSR